MCGGSRPHPGCSPCGNGWGSLPWQLISCGTRSRFSSELSGDGDDDPRFVLRPDGPFVCGSAAALCPWLLGAAIDFRYSNLGAMSLRLCIALPEMNPPLTLPLVCRHSGAPVTGVTEEEPLVAGIRVRFCKADSSEFGIIRANAETCGSKTVWPFM